MNRKLIIALLIPAVIAGAAFLNEQIALTQNNLPPIISESKGLNSRELNSQESNSQEVNTRESHSQESNSQESNSQESKSQESNSQELISKNLNIANNQCSAPANTSSYMRLETTGRKNALGNPLYELCLYAEGQLQGIYDTVTGRAYTQQNNRHRSGTQAPLPDGKYQIAENTLPGLKPESGTEFLPIFPLFNTGRSKLGIHYDPSFEKNNGQDGTGGCLALTNKADLDKVLQYFHTYRPKYMSVDIE